VTNSIALPKKRTRTLLKYWESGTVRGYVLYSLEVTQYSVDK